VLALCNASQKGQEQMPRQTFGLVGALLLVAVIGVAVGDGTNTSSVAVAQTPSDADASFRAALLLLNGVPDTTCSNSTPPPGSTFCIKQTSFSPGGMATFSACSDPGVQCQFVVLGQDLDGQWNIWFKGSAFSSLIASLPAQGLVCAYGGLALRSAPSIDADRLMVLPDRSSVSLDGFVLTAPASNRGMLGRGWYHVTAPEAGWASARYLLAADSPACQAASPAG
jgi:hypothetical protein